uniref:Putative secreted protein n=1 Tax=Ixodes ricinus TaxID=34613 RepID=A0A6B0URL7_IXORI
MPLMMSVVSYSLSELVLAMSTSDRSILVSSCFWIMPFPFLSHMSKMIRNLSSLLPLVKRTTVSRNSWKLIRSSLSLSTQLNICLTNRESGFMPRASANSCLDRDVRMTMITSLPTSSNFRFSPGFNPNVRA